MDKNQQYRLINRFLTGDISESENKQLQDWLQESTEHQKIFDEVEKIWQRINAPEPETVPPFEKFWHMLSEQLELVGQTKKASIFTIKRASPKTSIFTWFRGQISVGAMAAAAMLFLLMGGFAIYQKIFKATKYQIFVTQNNQQTEHILPDGSTVKLNSASEIIFKKNFSDSVRTIQLTGQAFFKVRPESRQFIVRTKNAQVEVLGTSFDVRARDLQTRVIVAQGKVALLSVHLPADSGIVLTADEMSVCKEHGKPSPPKRVDTKHLLGWLENRIVFDNTLLKEVADELQRIYDVKIKIEADVSSQLTISGEFEQEPVEEILSSICLALDLKYTYINSVYLISE